MNRSRRAITLIECIAAITLLAAALPPALTLVHDAADSRNEAMQIERATWFATALLEHIAADVASESTGMGFDALADTNTYLNTATTGLLARTQTFTTLYTQFNLASSIAIGSLVSADGTTTGNATLDVFRAITITVTWPSRSGTGSMSISRLVSDL